MHGATVVGDHGLRPGDQGGAAQQIVHARGIEHTATNGMPDGRPDRPILRSSDEDKGTFDAPSQIHQLVQGGSFRSMGPTDRQGHETALMGRGK